MQMISKRRLAMAFIHSNKKHPTSAHLPEMIMLFTLTVLFMLYPVSSQCARPCINGVNAEQCTDGGGLTCSCIIDDQVYYHGSQCEIINMDLPRRTAYWYSIDFHWPDPPQIHGNYSYVYHSLPYDEHINMSLKLFSMKSSRGAELRGLLPWQTLYTVCVINSTEAEIVYRTQDNSRLDPIVYADCIEERTRISYGLWICGWILLSIAIVLVVGGFSVYMYTRKSKRNAAFTTTNQPNVVYVT